MGSLRERRHVRGDVLKITRVGGYADGPRASWFFAARSGGDNLLERAKRDTMLVSGPAESADVIRGILAGPSRDIVVANAAVALWTVSRSPNLSECIQHATKAIDSGAARDLLARLVRRTLAG